jgi:hypothetical protein
LGFFLEAADLAVDRFRRAVSLNRRSLLPAAFLRGLAFGRFVRPRAFTDLRSR